MIKYLITLLLILTPLSVYASLDNPEKIALGTNIGHSYDPSPAFFFGQLSGAAIYNYSEIMHHPAPDALKLKLEGNVGAAAFSGPKLLSSFNFYAMYYLKGMETTWVKPYIEGGAGIIFNDFRVDGMGLRTNFNPQAGFGFEWPIHKELSCYTALHAYHISNGNLHKDNKGINGVLLQIGFLFL